MKILPFIYSTTFWFLQLFGVYAGSAPPHIIFMLIDDLGWNDVSFHGSLQIPTPNIDTLALNGVILNNYYVQPICTPSRGSLMTGKYPIKLGLQHYVIAASEPWGLSPEETLLPQHLKKLGYSTHGVGKWHLGYFRDDYLPTNRGFDSFFGYYGGKEDYFTHFDVEDDFSGLDFHTDNKNAWNYSGYYSTEAFTEKAKNIISSHNVSKPLFLYIAHQAVHAGNSYSPLQAPTQYIDQFPHIKDKKRKTFAAMASALDKSIGEVFAALHEKGMLENSIIAFSTDNGAAVEGIDDSTGSNWPLRGSKYTLWEGGVRGTAFIWSQLLPTFISKNLMHISDWMPTLVAAAGGNPTQLGEIDGYNFWPSLIRNSSSPRDSVLHNIDSEWQVESIRKNQYKLLKGSTFNGKFDGWFDKEGKRNNTTPFNDEELATFNKIYEKYLLKSEVFQILLKKYESDLFHYNNRYTKHYDSTDKPNTTLKINKDLLSFTHPVEVQCGRRPSNTSTNCLPLQEYCLFDIEQDPCEFNNLASMLPNVTKELKKLLDDYRKQVVPPRNKPKDPKANPKFHGYAWVPWIEKN